MAQAEWRYHGFSLSLREIELILVQRGIVVSCESIYACDAAVLASVRQHAQAASATAERYMAFGQGLRPPSRRHRLSDVPSEPRASCREEWNGWRAQALRCWVA